MRIDDSSTYASVLIFDTWSTPFDPPSGSVSDGGPRPTAGGSFGGGGSTDSWDDAPFGPDDYAAFDETTRVDQTEGRGSYDS